MSQYEELRERCCQVIIGRVPERVVDDILREVFRTLETVTPQMLGASAIVTISDPPSDCKIAEAEWLAMFRASPLAPPKEKDHD